MNNRYIIGVLLTLSLFVSGLQAVPTFLRRSKPSAPRTQSRTQGARKRVGSFFSAPKAPTVAQRYQQASTTGQANAPVAMPVMAKETIQKREGFFRRHVGAPVGAWQQQRGHAQQIRREARTDIKAARGAVGGAAQAMREAAGTVAQPSRWQQFKTGVQSAAQRMQPKFMKQVQTSVSGKMQPVKTYTTTLQQPSVQQAVTGEHKAYTVNLRQPAQRAEHVGRAAVAQLPAYGTAQAVAVQQQRRELTTSGQIVPASQQRVGMQQQTQQQTIRGRLKSAARKVGYGALGATSYAQQAPGSFTTMGTDLKRHGSFIKRTTRDEGLVAGAQEVALMPAIATAGAAIGTARAISVAPQVPGKLVQRGRNIMQSAQRGMQTAAQMAEQQMRQQRGPRQRQSRQPQLKGSQRALPAPANLADID